MSGSDSDEALMSRYAGGDANAFDVLYGRHKDASYRYFLRQLPEAAAADCHQTLWLNLIRARTRYQPTAPFRAYLFHLAHNVLTDQHRRSGRNPLTLVGTDTDGDPVRPDDLCGADDPAATLVRNRQAVRLMTLIRALPAAQRDALLLRAEAGLSIQEIADITRTSAEGIKSRLRYALRRLRAEFTDD
ncbi:MAG: sigma-70 family RNA polymerase sigma factor [Pseudomonadales bacterium]